jgi:hypothetical protein
MKKPLKWAITILGMLAVFAVVYVCGEKFGVTAGPIPTLVLMLAVYVAGWFWTRERPKSGEPGRGREIRPGAAAFTAAALF